MNGSLCLKDQGKGCSLPGDYPVESMSWLHHRQPRLFSWQPAAAQVLLTQIMAGRKDLAHLILIGCNKVQGLVWIVEDGKSQLQRFLEGGTKKSKSRESKTKRAHQKTTPTPF